MKCDSDCARFNQYRVDLPYPDAIVEKPDRRFAILVSDAYAGRGSEMTAVTQYISHSYFTENYPEASEAYRYIPMVELIHLKLLGSLIKRLGLYPKLYSCQAKRFWNGSFPVYQSRLKQILESDIIGEKEAIDHYRRLIAQTENRSIQDLFHRIILDEEKHIEVLSGLLELYE